MKFIVRSCNKRLWYVKQFLIPDLIENGISEDDIIHINDDNQEGCLSNWLRACRTQLEECDGGAWHLQDDVLIASNFSEVAGSVPTDIVCNGFVTKDFNPKEIYDIGIVPVQKYWCSFPCIYVPDVLIAEFLDWYHQKIVVEGKYRKYVEMRRYDDRFFWQLMKERHKDDNCLNIVPNMVEHVDNLLGGSVANNDIAKRKAKSFYWVEPDKEKELIRRMEK